VLGLPWEYTAADVRALIEAAAEADGTRAAEAGVEAVEVAYRDDGKSEVGINMPGRLGVLYGMSYSPPSVGLFKFQPLCLHMLSCHASLLCTVPPGLGALLRS